jgi:hypothetical protein
MGRTRISGCTRGGIRCLWEVNFPCRTVTPAVSLSRSDKRYEPKSTIWFASITLHKVKHCLTCYIPIVRPLLTHRSWLRSVPFTWSRNTAHGGCEQSRGFLYLLLNRSQRVWPIKRIITRSHLQGRYFSNDCRLFSALIQWKDILHLWMSYFTK